ncbi:MAG: nuclear transport factor 2 family protein [Steroidobacteraceae bacterium]
MLASLCAQAGARTVSIDQSELRRLRTDARTARDVQEIQNLMSRRAMLHSIGHNEEELDLWSRTQEIRWAQNGGCWIGNDYRRYYVEINFAMQKAQLAALSRANPAIEDDFAKNRYIGSTVLHVLTTPIIEIAADGQTAKAFWYTPGVILSSPDGKQANGVNMWERYGVDLVREQGRWRFLHIEVITDFAYPFGGDLSTPVPGMPKADASRSGSEGSSPSPGPGAQGLKVPGPTLARQMGETYSPLRVPRLTPRLPEAYRTLSETFEYADCRRMPAMPTAAPSGAAPSRAAPPGAPPPPMTGDPSRNPDMREFAAEVDTDHDGKMSRQEWQAKGLPSSSFNMFERGRGYVLLEDFQKNPAPPGIDLDGDGKLTVEEFREFDRKMSAQMGKGGKAGP